jgi:predicted AAA+ superfamily ATPase
MALALCHKSLRLIATACFSVVFLVLWWLRRPVRAIFEFLAGALGVDGKTVARHLDLMVDLLLVRRLPPFHANDGKRLVKSPKIYVRDSGLVHTLLRCAPARARPSFYRTATGVEVDLLLELPGGVHWAIEIKRGLAPRVERGLRVAMADLHPARTFLVYSGEERYPQGDGVEVIGVRELAALLAASD